MCEREDLGRHGAESLFHLEWRQREEHPRGERQDEQHDDTWQRTVILVVLTGHRGRAR